LFLDHQTVGVLFHPPLKQLKCQMVPPPSSGRPERAPAGVDQLNVQTDDGIRIEMKVDVYLKAWERHRHSNTRFSGLCARTLARSRTV
jgi:hypothetical protein